MGNAKRIGIWLLVLGFCAVFSCSSGKKNNAIANQPAAEKIFIILDRGAPVSSVDSVTKKISGRVIDYIPEMNMLVIEIPKGTAERAIREYLWNPNVRRGGPNPSYDF